MDEQPFPVAQSGFNNRYTVSRYQTAGIHLQERSPLMSMPFYVRDIMSRDVITVRPEHTAEQALEVFQANQISGAPVVDSSGAVVGVISSNDLLKTNSPLSYGITNYFEVSLLDKVLAEEGFHLESINDGLVSDLMTHKVYSVQPETPVEEAAAKMLEHHIHRLIVISPETGKPQGIVSTFDLLKLIAENKNPQKSAATV